MNKKWEIIIGLEVHVQLATASKLFSGSATAYGRKQNSQACIIDLGFPGVLPTLNAEAIRLAIKLGLAINGKIAEQTSFARKNYFYPDLPKGYQISQHQDPIIKDGYLNIDLDAKDDAIDAIKTIHITHAHLEEDAGKLMHENFHGFSGIDFNRAGIPLIEIVSAPDLRSAREAVIYLKTLHNLVRYLGISDGNMQEGSFRCDANVSVRKCGAQELGTRTEIKNLNSFRFIERAIEFEAARQISVLESRNKIIQETRLYDAEKNETRAMRSKEESLDYRYFPDPDLLPLVLEKEYVEEIRSTLPELPWEKCARFHTQYELSKYDANILSANLKMAKYFEETAENTNASAKTAANWIIVELLGALNKYDSEISASPISAKQLAELLDKIHDQTISGKIAKEVFFSMFNGEGTAMEIIEKNGLKQITDDNVLTKIIDDILAANQNAVKNYQAGKTQLFGFFVGQVMQVTGGKASPKQVNELLKNKLG